MNKNIKIQNIGTSKGIIIPSSWFNYYKIAHNATIKEVSLEIGETITIKPIIKEATGED
jgi:antitoxin component of MazEF toxin-antitoxin module